MADDSDARAPLGIVRDDYPRRGERSDFLTSTAGDEVNAYLMETSYQLRTPLSAIVGYSELLMEDAEDPDEVRLLAYSIRTATKSLMEVIQHLEEQVMRERARRRVSELLRSLSTMMASSLEFEEVIATIHQCLEEIIDFDRSEVLLRHSHGAFEVVAMREGQETTRPDRPLVRVEDDPRLQQIDVSHQALIVADLQNDPRLGELKLESEARSWLGAPLLWSDELIGILTLEHADLRKYDVFDGQLVSSLGTQAGLAIVNARHYSEVRHRADVDGLTGAMARRRFFELADEAFQYAKHVDTPLAVLMLDIDHFKDVNDTYGHAAGDFVLHETIHRCSGQLRGTDTIGRYGGEEFVVLLPGLDLERAVPIAERLREAVATEPFHVGNHVIEVTISIGVAEQEATTPDLAHLVESADVALYKAKRRGRNRVETTAS